jgi:hypothetical protein
MRLLTSFASGILCLTLAGMTSAAEIPLDGTVTTINATEPDVLIPWLETFFTQAGCRGDVFARDEAASPVTCRNRNAADVSFNGGCDPRAGVRWIMQVFSGPDCRGPGPIIETGCANVPIQSYWVGIDADGC